MVEKTKYEYMASCHGDHSVKVHHVKSGKFIYSLKGFSRTPWAVAFHPGNNDIIAAGCLNGTVQIHVKEDLVRIWNCDIQGGVGSLVFHPSLPLLAIACGSALYFWNDFMSGLNIRVVFTPTASEYVRFIKFSPCGKYLLTSIRNPTSLSPSEQKFYTTISHEDTGYNYSQNFSCCREEYHSEDSTTRPLTKSQQKEYNTVLNEAYSSKEKSRANGFCPYYYSQTKAISPFRLVKSLQFPHQFMRNIIKLDFKSALSCAQKEYSKSNHLVFFESESKIIHNLSTPQSCEQNGNFNGNQEMIQEDNEILEYWGIENAIPQPISIPSVFLEGEKYSLKLLDSGLLSVLQEIYPFFVSNSEGSIMKAIQILRYREFWENKARQLAALENVRGISFSNCDEGISIQQMFALRRFRVFSNSYNCPPLSEISDMIKSQILNFEINMRHTTILYKECSVIDKSLPHKVLWPFLAGLCDSLQKDRSNFSYESIEVNGKQHFKVSATVLNMVKRELGGASCPWLVVPYHMDSKKCEEMSGDNVNQKKEEDIRKQILPSALSHSHVKDWLRKKSQTVMCKKIADCPTQSLISSLSPLSDTVGRYITAILTFTSQISCIVKYNTIENREQSYDNFIQSSDFSSLIDIEGIHRFSKILTRNNELYKNREEFKGPENGNRRMYNRIFSNANIDQMQLIITRIFSEEHDYTLNICQSLHFSDPLQNENSIQGPNVQNHFLKEELDEITKDNHLNDVYDFCKCLYGVHPFHIVSPSSSDEDSADDVTSSGGTSSPVQPRPKTNTMLESYFDHLIEALTKMSDESKADDSVDRVARIIFEFQKMVLKYFSFNTFVKLFCNDPFSVFAWLGVENDKNFQLLFPELDNAEQQVLSFPKLPDHCTIPIKTLLRKVFGESIPKLMHNAIICHSFLGPTTVYEHLEILAKEITKDGGLSISDSKFFSYINMLSEMHDSYEVMNAILHVIKYNKIKHLSRPFNSKSLEIAFAFGQSLALEAVNRITELFIRKIIIDKARNANVEHILVPNRMPDLCHANLFEFSLGNDNLVRNLDILLKYDIRNHQHAETFDIPHLMKERAILKYQLTKPSVELLHQEVLRKKNDKGYKEDMFSYEDVVEVFAETEREVLNQTIPAAKMKQFLNNIEYRIKNCTCGSKRLRFNSPEHDYSKFKKIESYHNQAYGLKNEPPRTLIEIYALLGEITLNIATVGEFMNWNILMPFFKWYKRCGKRIRAIDIRRRWMGKLFYLKVNPRDLLQRMISETPKLPLRSPSDLSNSCNLDNNFDRKKKIKPTSRVQLWEFGVSKLPNIADRLHNLVIPAVIGNNDASLSISEDWKRIAALVPVPGGKFTKLTVGVYSLLPVQSHQNLYEKNIPPTIGTPLYSTLVNSHTVSVSFSPSGKLLVLGRSLAASRNSTTESYDPDAVLTKCNPDFRTRNDQSFAHIVKLDGAGEITLVRTIDQFFSGLASASSNSMTWLPRPHHGLVGTTNLGFIFVVRFKNELLKEDKS